MGTENKQVSGGQGLKVGTMKIMGTFLSDRIVLCLDCDSSYMSACTCQNLQN